MCWYICLYATEVQATEIQVAEIQVAEIQAAEIRATKTHAKRRPMLRKMAVYVVMVFAFLAIAVQLWPRETVISEKDIGQPKPHASHAAAPRFDLFLLNGTSFSSDRLLGTPYLLHFWATWCTPCVAELPELMKLAMMRKDIRIITVSVDRKPGDVKNFLLRHKMSPPPNMVMAIDPTRQLTQRMFQVFSFPETIIIDAKGNMTHKFVGPQSWLTTDVMKQLSHSLAPDKSPSAVP